MSIMWCHMLGGCGQGGGAAVVAAEPEQYHCRRGLGVLCSWETK